MRDSFIVADGRRLECRWHGPEVAVGPVLVFLHEGLGSVSMWRDFPDLVANACGWRGFSYSRAGYGQSDAADLPRSMRFMHDEALVVLPQVLDAAGIERTVLIGHSDGASIAIVRAGDHTDRRTEAAVLMAPHVITEEFGIESIRRAGVAFRQTDFRERLARHHGDNVDGAFNGWHDAWVSPEFESWNLDEYVRRIDVPTLIIQGVDDQYGTARQVELIEARVGGPVSAVMLPECGHSPHRDRPQQTLAAIKRFVTGL